MIIAIDGHSSCGKSTIAKQIAQHLNYIYVDSGAMYRCVTLFALQNGIINDRKIDEEKLKNILSQISITFNFDRETARNITFLNGTEVEEIIRTLDVSSHVSEISKIRFVRQRMVEIQREIGKNGKIVIDGRDIGTVVFPDADIKFFITASIDVRSKRRYTELRDKGEMISIEEIKKNLILRDETDSTREESPLKKAPDAILLDNSNHTPESQLEWALKIIKDYELRNISF